MAASQPELIAAQSLGWLAGYDLGRSEMRHWEPVAQAYNQRLSQLVYGQTVRPFGLFVAVPGSEVSYNEAVCSYLFGLPNASVPLSARSLEVGLAHAYALSNPGRACPDLNDLIQWAQNLLGPRHQLAHSVRLLRNLIHQTTPVAEISALEAIRHVSLLVDCFLPFQTAYVVRACPLCRMNNGYTIPRTNYVLGYVLPLLCGSCRQQDVIQIL